MSSDHRIGDLYESAMRHEFFLETFQRTIQTLGADCFHMYTWDESRNMPALSSYTPGMNLDALIGIYEQYYAAIDPRRALVDAAGTGQLVLCQEHLSDQYVSRSEFFQDFQIPAGIRYLMGVKFATPDNNGLLLGLLRSSERKEYSSADKENAQSILHHLGRSISLWHESKHLHRNAAIGNELTANMGLALFALNRERKIVYANEYAENLIKSSAELKSVGGHLVAVDAQENAHLQAALQRVGKLRQAESVALRGLNQLCAHRLFLNIAYLPATALQSVFDNAVLMVTVRSRPDAAQAGLAQLRQSFGLSKAEATVAQAMLQGRNADECSALLGVSITTIRSQLRAIYEKTQTRSHAEAMIALMSVLPVRR